VKILFIADSETDNEKYNKTEIINGTMKTLKSQAEIWQKNIDENENNIGLFFEIEDIESTDEEFAELYNYIESLV